MGVVKYTGPVASFHCPTNAEIRSLKVHFSPKQEGTGDPSPENVREIVGWDGIEQYYSGKNIGHIAGYSASATVNRIKTNTYGTTINTINYEGVHGEVVVTQSQAPESDLAHYRNGYIDFYPDNLIWNQRYDFSFRVSNIISNPLNATLNNLKLINPYGGQSLPIEVVGDRVYYKNILNKQRVDVPNLTGFDIRICGMSCTISDIMITPANSNDQVYESYHGSTTNYEFGVLGKNKLPIETTTFTRYKKYTLDNPLLPGTYTISATITSNDSDSARSLILFQNPDTSSPSAQRTLTRNTRISSTIDLPYECSNVYIYAGNSYAASADDEATWTDVQLELGFTATEYEPYNPNKTVYGGWVDLITGEVQEQYVLLDKPWSEWGNKTTFNDGTELRYVNFGVPVKGNSMINFKTSLCNVAKYSYKNEDGTTHYYIVGTSYNCRVYLPTGTDENTQIQVLGELVTPLTYHLSPIQLQTFMGHNNIWSNADYIEVEYDLHETQDILARKQFIIANQPHIETLAPALLQNFNTDMVAPLKECKVHFEPVQDLHGYSKPWVGGTGKNLFNANNWWQNDGGITVINENKITCGVVSYVENKNRYTLPSQSVYVLSFHAKTLQNASGLAYVNIRARTEEDLTVSSSKITLGDVGNEQDISLSIPDTAYYFQFNDWAYNGIVELSNIQLEKGSTITTYEPWENICPISGWTGVIVGINGKNFSTAATGTEMAQKWPLNSDSSRYQLVFSGMPPGQEFTLSASFTAAYETSSNRRLYLIGSQTANSVTNSVFQGPSPSEAIDRVIHNWVNADGIIRIAHNKRGLTYTSTDVEYAASLQNIQLELGNTATEFEPYQGTVIPITFPSMNNILNASSITNNKTLSNTGEEISESGMSVTNFIKVNENDVYTLTFISKEGPRTRRIYGYNSNKEPVEALGSVSWVTVDTMGTLQATIPNGIKYIKVCYKTADENIFLEGPESSIAYGGYIDLIKGEITKEVIKITTDDIVAFHDITDRGNGIYEICLNLQEYARSDRREEAKCNCFTYGSTDTGIAERFYLTYVLSQKARQIRINHYFEETPTIETYKEYLQSINFEVVYYIDPESYQIDSQTLKTLRGKNNIWSNANGPIELKYWTH